MTVLRSPWQKIQHYFWLVGGVGCLFTALVFGAITDREEIVEVKQQAETEVELHIQPEKVATMTHLGAMHDEVKPLDMSTRTIESSVHEAEFRGTKYVSDAKKQHTIEVFRVRDELILKNFLKTRSDRNKFTYLRLSPEDLPEQYVLLYGLYKSDHEAKAMLSQLDLKLPETVQPKTVAMQVYLPLVNSLGADELSSNTKLYQVNLKNVALPKVDEAEIIKRRAEEKANATARAQASDATHATTSTTITRRDESGQVVDVETTETKVETRAPSQTRPVPVQEIDDPFN